MSQMAPETPARKENVFTRKIGPLPMWVWLLIIGGAIIAYSLYKSRTAGATSGATGTDASQVPQFVNQTYTTVVPPVATPPTPPSPGPGPLPGKPPFHPKPNEPPPGRGGGGPTFRSERLRHRGNLLQIAKRNGIDEEDLIEANPELAKYKGTGRQLPVGTVVRIPPAGI